MAARVPIILPTRVFLYTLDQLCVMLNVSEDELRMKFLHFDGVSTGVSGMRMIARDVAPDDVSYRDWRVSEQELVRYLQRKGFRVEMPKIR